MFIRESSQAPQPFERLAPRFVTTDWLHPLGIAAAGDALQSVYSHTAETSPGQAIMVWPETLRFELSPARVQPDALAVAMRWNSRLSPELFPELFDGDLRVERVNEARSDLTVVGTYPHTRLPSVQPGVIQHATQAWARVFLANILRSFLDTSPPDPPR